MTPALHPWLATTAAYQSAQRAVRIPFYKLPDRSRMIGQDELLSEALSLLTECALPPREEAQTVCAECGGLIPGSRRRNAKYCSQQCNNRAGVRRHRNGTPPPPQPPKTHIGSMWTWPEEEMMAYAVREVGFRLCHYVAQGKLETPSSPAIANLAVAAPGDTDEASAARDLIEEWLENAGFRVDGTETLEELAEAIRHAKALA